MTAAGVAAEAAIVDGGRVGVGGISRGAHRGDSPAGSAALASRLVREWSGDPAGFPYAETLAHYRLVGRNNADPGLISELRRLYDGLPTDRSLLREWLPSTFDQETGNYDSYIGSAAFDAVVSACRSTAQVTRSTDALVVAAAADLALLEVAALEDSDHSEQQVRTRATARVLARVDALAPDFQVNAGTLGDLRQALRPGDSAARLAETTRFAAAAVLKEAPAVERQAVEISLLPTTRLHDEQMFIRCIQIFEGVYQQVRLRLADAVRYLVGGSAQLTVQALDEASARVEATPALYRVLTTMPQEVFAVIREFTHGRSAVQSKAYREVEARTAPRPVSPDAARMAPLPEVELTLQDAFEAQGDRLPAAQLAPVATAMNRLDGAWHAMKLSHWGLTLKIIGRVPGTGGTAGAAYLEQAAAVRLFPALHTATP